MRHNSSHIGDAVRAVLAAVCLSCALWSCSEPASREYFVKNSRCDAYGRYVFEVDMSDSLTTYSFDIYAAFTCAGGRFAKMSSLPCNVLWESPQKNAYEENIILRSNPGDASSYYGNSLCNSFRGGVRPSEYGAWKVYLSVPADSAARYGLTGMGLKIQKDNGTR